VEEHDADRPRDITLGRLYDALLTAQNLAEMAGLAQMARALREMRRRTHVALALGATPDSRDETND
jgi:hypothetical protein